MHSAPPTDALTHGTATSQRVRSLLGMINSRLVGHLRPLLADIGSSHLLPPRVARQVRKYKT